MRFRTNIDNVPTFMRIIQAVDKLQRRCIIKFTETEIRIICNNDANEGGIQIKVDSIFSNYRIQSNAQNEITLLIPTDALIAALRSASCSGGAPASSAMTTEDVTMKLAKKNDVAVLSFEISGMSRSGRRVNVAHDVRIEVMKPADVARIEEPRCPEPDVHLVLPSLQKMRTITERLRPLADVMAIRASGSGKVVLGISTDALKLETTWNGCTIPEMTRDELTQATDTTQNKPDPSKLHTVHVPVKSFVKFLNSHNVSTTTIACICQNYCLILYVYIGDLADAGGVLTFYIPAVLDHEM